MARRRWSQSLRADFTWRAVRAEIVSFIFVLGLANQPYAHLHGKTIVLLNDVIYTPLK